MGKRKQSDIDDMAAKGLEAGKRYIVTDLDGYRHEGKCDVGPDGNLYLFALKPTFTRDGRKNIIVSCEETDLPREAFDETTKQMQAHTDALIARNEKLKHSPKVGDTIKCKEFTATISRFISAPILKHMKWVICFVDTTGKSRIWMQEEDGGSVYDKNGNVIVEQISE